MTETLTRVDRRPQYIENREQLLLDKIFGTPTTTGEGADAVTTYTGGLLDAEAYPDLFKIPEYQLAEQTDPQLAALSVFDTPEGRQAFMDRAQPYFTDAQGRPRYLGEADTALSSGYDTILSGINNYFPTASQYITEGRGAIDAGSIYDSELGGARSRGDQGTQAFDARGRADDLFSSAQDIIKGGLGSFDPSESVSKFMNPYKQQVIDEAMAQIDRQGAQTMAKNNAYAVGAGAFGGARQGVQAAETERGLGELKNKTISDMLSTGYDSSLNAAYTADEAGKKRAIDAGQQIGSFGKSALDAEGRAFGDAESRVLKNADLYRSMGLSSADARAKALSDEKTRSLESGRLYGGLGQTVGGLGGDLASVGSSYGTLAGTGADIGRVYSAMAPSDLSYMYNAGGAGQTYDQAYLDNYRRNQMRATDQALYPIEYGYDALSGTPSANMSTRYDTSPNPGNNAFTSGAGLTLTGQGINQSQ